MFVSIQPLNKLSYVINGIFQRFAQDLFSSEARLTAEYSLLSPTAQTTFVGLFHKVLIYLTEGFVVIGAAVVALKPKTMKFKPEFRLMALSATIILIVCLVVPNVAPALNFSRFYRAITIFLSPLFVVGGIYVLKLFKKIRFTRAMFGKVTFKCFELLILAIILSAFFLFRVGFANYVSGDYPISYSLNLNNMNTFGISILEPDIFGAKWIATKIENNSVAYADDLGAATLSDYTNLSRDNTYPLLNTTEPLPGSYIYLRGLNTMKGVVSFDLTASYTPYKTSDLSPILKQSDKIYSNGQSEAYYITR
jgi:uncharacterized membrane protein